MTLEQERALALARARVRVQEQQSAAAPPPVAAPERAASAGDKALGSVPGRVALGASQVVTGPFQLGANVGEWVGRKVLAPAAEALGAEGLALSWRDNETADAVNTTMQVVEESKKRGMKALGTEGFDWAGLAGTVATGGGALAKGGGTLIGAVKPATSILGKIGQGSAVGAGFGAATPVTDGGEDFFEKKALQTGTGAVIGGAIPATTATVGGVGRFVGEVRDLVTDKGAGRIATRFQKEIIGEGNLRPVIDALRNIKPTVPGAKPTAAEALVGVPGGSPIAASQAATAKTSGGASAQFGQRALDQQAARTAAQETLSATTKPMRTAALDAANVKGVDANGVHNRIMFLANQPGRKASTIIQKVLGTIDEKISELSFNNGGKIDAHDLYTIRKEIGNVIKTHAKETSNWDKKLSAGLQRDVQKAIDDAIEAAGGKGWKQYLDTYSKGRSAIEADLERANASLKPLQRTLLAGGDNTAATIPNLLSRPAMLANAALRLMRLNVEPRVDAVMVERYLNPQLLADALEKATPSQLRSVTQEMWKQYGRAATVGAPVTAIAEAEGAQ